MKTAANGSESGVRVPRLVGAGGYLLFVAYGSLVPLDFRPHPMAEAWRDFLATPYLALDVGSRADWIANLLLYIPLAYLLCAALVRGIRSTAGRLLAVGLVFCFCTCVAIGIEFTQLFFPPRTVSLNDIIAECVGSALGIFVWLVGGNAAERIWVEMKRGGLPAIRAAIVVYLLAYIAFGLFPYDFLVSANEFAAKLAAGAGYGLIVARESCTSSSNCAGKLLAEALAVVPLGALLSMVLGKSARRVYATAALCGLLLGLALEIAQLFLASGVSEGISLVTRITGITLGVYLHRHTRLRALAAFRPYAATAVLIAAPVYLIALTWASSWFAAGWFGVGRAVRGLREIHWLPFYYHYFTTETHALLSLIACVVMYLPLGVGYWMWTLRTSYGDTKGSAVIPALIALPLALVLEMGKLFVPGKHPDPTDILIAMFAAAAGFRIAEQLHQWALQAGIFPREARTGRPLTVVACPDGHRP